jgi:hypothetical protein
MGTTSFSQRVLMVLGVVLFITMLCLAIEMGLVGARLQERLRQYWYPVHSLYLSNKAASDLAILIVGSSISAVFTSLALLKSFYYAEITLPVRLQELCKAVKKQHLEQRAELLAYVETPFKTQDFLAPALFSNPFSKLLSSVGYESTRSRARQFATTVQLLDDEIKALATKIEDFENQKVTGHLIRACYFAAVASELDATTVEWRHAVESARTEYTNALKIRPLDLAALEGAAAQSRILTDEPSEIAHLNKILAATDPKRVPLACARALRQLAEIFNKHSLLTSWNEARARLVSAAALLEKKLGYGAEEVAEMATIQVVFGEVQTKREKFTSARGALEEADTLFNNVAGERGAKGKQRVIDARAKLEVAASDREASGN